MLSFDQEKDQEMIKLNLQNVFINQSLEIELLEPSNSYQLGQNRVANISFVCKLSVQHFLLKSRHFPNMFHWKLFSLLYKDKCYTFWRCKQTQRINEWFLLHATWIDQWTNVLDLFRRKCYLAREWWGRCRPCLGHWAIGISWHNIWWTLCTHQRFK